VLIWEGGKWLIIQHAWTVKLRHQYSYLFVYPIEIPAGANTLTLPRNHNIKIVAATAVKQEQQAWPAQPLYDVLDSAETQNRSADTP
jgi:hypothetical protein